MPPADIRHTLKEVAEYLRTSERVVRSMIRAKSLRALQVGPPGSKRPRYIVRACDLEDYEARAATTPAPEATRRKRQLPDIPNYLG